MKKLIEKINKIPKNYFSLNDLKKIAGRQDGSLKVTVSRLVKDGKLAKIGGGYYALDAANVDWERFALETYAPSYLSFESALARYGILSQKPYALTLATVRRSKTVSPAGQSIIYRHLQPRLFWGYGKMDDILIAEPEKAWLDLAYLSLNGYARFDHEEMDMSGLDRKKIKAYLKKFASKKLDNLISRL